MLTLISRFTERVTFAVKRVADDWDEPTAPERGGGFTDAAMISLHCLWIYLNTTYRMTIYLLTEMPKIYPDIGRFKTDLPDHSTLCLAFDRIEMKLYRTLLEQSVQLHNTGLIGVIDATYFERSPASRSYSNKTKYDVQDLKVTKLVDTEDERYP